MATKKSSSRVSKKLESFNRSQEIYQVLEKGIIESEALLNSAADRPDDDAHIVELLESTSGEQTIKLNSRSSVAGRRTSPKKKGSRPSKPAKKAKAKGKKR